MTPIPLFTGQERFGNMTRVYYKDAVGAIVLFDVTRADTLAVVDKWKADLDGKVVLEDGRPIPAVLVGNKCDQPLSAGISKTAVESLAREKGFEGSFLASAREDTNVKEAADFLIARILENERLKRHANGHSRLRGFDLADDGARVFGSGDDGERKKKKRGGCC